MASPADAFIVKFTRDGAMSDITILAQSETEQQILEPLAQKLARRLKALAAVLPALDGGKK